MEKYCLLIKIHNFQNKILKKYIKKMYFKNKTPKKSIQSMIFWKMNKCET